ncbi:hypothetical protein HID58_019454 [Brassica napus]|uniref:Uncharacterized protein n=1 Tax=Brassica napus TaxID=3708 RepID=A0ABQ8DDC9_BRANA|nr:hypothetical protein HID58_019454 [Brassica napus]
MALGALDLLLDADCARIWVRSEIRDPPEASTCRDRPRLCSAVSPQSIYSSAQKAASMVFLSEGLSPLPRSHRLQKGLEDYPRRRRLLRIGLCFPSPSGHLFQGVPCSFCASSPIPKLPVDCCFVTLLSSLHLLCRAAE